METLLYNAIPASTSLSGDRFFYSNPLHLRTGHTGDHEDAPSQRRPWFSCACCPPNVARLLAAVHDYLLTRSPDGLQIQHPADLSARVTLPDGDVMLEVRTGYPDDGVVRLTVETSISSEWELSLRIPSWCRSHRVTLDGVVLATSSADGYLRIRRVWQGRSQVVLDLRMPVRRIAAHPRVDAVRGCVALARGPVIHALEDADLPDGVVLEDVRLLEILDVEPDDPGAPPASLRALVALEPAPDRALYTDLTEPSTPSQLSEPFHVELGPYHRWANRSPGAMRVWIPLAVQQSQTR
jgi:DUF1680 family protein